MAKDLPRTYYDFEGSNLKLKKFAVVLITRCTE